jgi:hypothetical protein
MPDGNNVYNQAGVKYIINNAIIADTNTIPISAL